MDVQYRIIEQAFLIKLPQKFSFRLLSLEEAFQFWRNSFADEHKTLPKSTKGSLKSNKYAFGAPWLGD